MATLWDRLLRRAIYPGGYNESYYTGAEYVAVDDTPGGLKERSVAGMVRVAREAYAANGIVFGCQAMRMMLISEARFKFQRMTDDTLFGNSDLAILEHPWPNGDTGDLLKRIEQDGAMGNAFYRRVDPPGGDKSMLIEMRPEAVTIISQVDHDSYGRPYRHVIGYAEDMGPGTDPSFFSTDEVSHFAPLPDPFARTRGMSWITPIMREVYSDTELTKYKTFHLANGAQPGLVVKYSSRLSDKIVDTLRKRLRARYGGPENAGNVLVLDEGADAMVTGSTLDQLQFDAVTKAGERRVCSAANVPLEIMGLEKGDYQTAIRRMADLWARPTWRMICASLEHLVPTSAPSAVPVRLWFDVSGVAALREGELQRAQGFLVKAQGMAASIAAGMKRESAIAAATTGDLGLLVPDPNAPPPGTSARLTGKDSNAPGQPAGQPPTGGPAGTIAGRPPQAGKPQQLPGVGGKNLPNATPAKAAVSPGGAAPKPVTAKRSDDQADADRLVEYLAWLNSGGGLLDLAVLESSRAEYPLASDNERAWALVAEDPRFIRLGLSALEARMLTDGSVDSATRANWNPRLHPRDPGGRFAGGGGVAAAGGGTVTALHRSPALTDAHVVAPEVFDKAFTAAFKGSPYAAFVNHYTPAEIKAGNMTPVLAAGGKAGMLVHPHGDGRVEPTALFNDSGQPGVGLALLRSAIAEHGANYVEAFGPALPKMYGTLGFKDSGVYPFDPSEAPANWDSGRFDHPDYHLMTLPGTHLRAAADGPGEGMDLPKIQAEAAARDQAWWDQYGEDAWDAALVAFGIAPPAGAAPDDGGGSPARRSRDLGPEHQAVLGEIGRLGGQASTRALRSRRIIDGWDFSLGAVLSVLVRTGLVVQTGEDDAVTYHLAGEGGNPFGQGLSRAGWDPAKHPRVAHGTQGGQFARHPGGGLPWSGSGAVTFHGSHGVDRSAMPQLSGVDHTGQYQAATAVVPRFRAYLADHGVKTTEKRMLPGDLKPTQTQGDMKVIRSIADDLKSGKLADTKPVVISSDGRVLDGTHTWAGRLLAAREGGRAGLNPQMPVIQADVPIDQLLAHARDFGNREGISARKTGQMADPKFGGAVHQPSLPDSQARYKGPDGKYTPARQILHDKIVGELLAGHHPQEHPTATFFGGGPASGKSALTAGPDSVKIDADEIKGKLPEYAQMLAAKDPNAAAYVHEESSDIAKAVQAGAEAQRFNFTLDGTGDSEYTKMLGKIQKARRNGYRADGQYVSVDTEEAVKRATARAAQTGRMVPASVIRAVHQSVSNVLPALIANGEFDSVKLFDNNGSGPVLVGEMPPGGSWVVHDEKAWARFLAKGHPGG